MIYLCVNTFAFYLLILSLKGKSLLGYTNLFIISWWIWKEWQNNTRIFSITKKIKIKISIVLSVENIENLKILKYHIFFL